MFRKYIFLLLMVSCTTLQAQSVAIIGGGGAGLTTAWLLDNDYDVTVYEALDRLGGNANSITVDANGKPVTVEAGFEFFTPVLFPTFINLLNILNVPLHQYTLTYTFYDTDGSNVLALPPIHDGIINWSSFTPKDIIEEIQLDIVIHEGRQLIQNQDVGITLEDFLDGLILTDGFKNGFLYPFLASNWGVPISEIKTFAAYNTLKYIVRGKDVKDYQWNEVVGGTQMYIHALASQITHGQIKLSSQIANITYDGKVYTISEADGTSAQYDMLVMATDATTASQLLSSIPETLNVRTLLNQIEYFHTTIAIHGDTRFLPPKSKDWGVVNVRYDGINSALSIHKEWLSPSSPVIKSWLTFNVLAPGQESNPMPDPLYALVYYIHPKTTLQYYQVQKSIGMVQGERNLWFAGYWTWDNDSHESAIMSAVRVAQSLAPGSTRLIQLTNF